MYADQISALIIILRVILAIALPFATAVMTLKLIDRAAKKNRQPVKLVLADLFCLMFIVQIPLAFFFQVYEGSQAIAPALVIAATMILVWWASIRAISQAGISQTSTRAIISLLVVPMTYMGTFATIWLTLLITSPSESFEQYSIEKKIWLYAIEALLVVLMIASYLFTRYAVSTAEPHDQDAN